MANHYRCSDGTRVSKKTIDQRIRKAKAEKLQEHFDEYGYYVCTNCFSNSCKPIDVSHVISVDEAQKTGKTELSWDLNNLKILGRQCHQKHDKLNLNFLSST